MMQIIWWMVMKFRFVLIMILFLFSALFHLNNRYYIIDIVYFNIVTLKRFIEMLFKTQLDDWSWMKIVNGECAQFRVTAIWNE